MQRSEVQSGEAQTDESRLCRPSNARMTVERRFFDALAPPNLRSPLDRPRPPA